MSKARTMDFDFEPRTGSEIHRAELAISITINDQLQTRKEETPLPWLKLHTLRLRAGPFQTLPPLTQQR